MPKRTFSPLSKNSAVGKNWGSITVVLEMEHRILNAGSLCCATQTVSERWKPQFLLFQLVTTRCNEKLRSSEEEFLRGKPRFFSNSRYKAEKNKGNVFLRLRGIVLWPPEGSYLQFLPWNMPNGCVIHPIKRRQLLVSNVVDQLQKSFRSSFAFPRWW